MATPPKKPAKRAKAKPRPSTGTKFPPRPTQKIELLQRELADALEQQRAAGDILRMIRTSSTGLQPVLDAIAESAARLCDSYDAQIFRLENNVITRVASYGPLLLAMERTPLNRRFPVGRAMVDRQTVHIHDLAAEVDAEYAEVKSYQQKIGHRTTLAVPFLQDGTPIGAILIRRLEVRPFTEPQIKLLETFADQAVIAIENARLFHEQQARNRDLTEALEQQTATSEILRVIASSPADIQPMLDTIAESAARLCESYDAVIQCVDGDFLFRAAHFGAVPVGEVRPIPLTRELPSGRAIVDRQTIHVDDVSLEIETEYPDVAEIQKRSGSRTVLATPLLSRGVPIGVINVRRMEVQPFSDKQIKLLETFADQAVIAIENARLFQELKESLEQQTATSEILGVIASSPTDIQPVLDVIAENAARICGTSDVSIVRVEDDGYRVVATYGSAPNW
ncbi:MAG: GAF domain-containing protein, partial [Candidatus Binatia bacterium]